MKASEFCPSLAKGDAPANPVLSEIVRRIVDAVCPEQIFLFGSAARGEDHMGSDLDLLVVKPCASRRNVAAEIYRNLIGVGQAVDVVVVTPEDLERYRSSPALVIESALRDGKLLYAS
jgi:uncharacterized protein